VVEWDERSADMRRALALARTRASSGDLPLLLSSNTRDEPWLNSCRRALRGGRSTNVELCSMRLAFPEPRLKR